MSGNASAKGPLSLAMKISVVLQLAGTFERGVELADPVIQFHDHVLVRIFRERFAGKVGVGVIVVVAAPGGEVEEEWLPMSLVPSMKRTARSVSCSSTTRMKSFSIGKTGLASSPEAFDDSHHLALRGKALRAGSWIRSGLRRARARPCNRRTR